MDIKRRLVIPNPKAYLVHIYYEATYIETKSFDTQLSLKRFLRESNVTFCNSLFTLLEEDSITLNAPPFSYEIEESLNSSRAIEINGVKYISISEYCKRTKIPPYKARYDLSVGKLKGLWIGRNHLRYIQESEVRYYDRCSNT